MHEVWSCCWTWRMLGGAASVASLLCALALGALAARTPRRALVGVALGVAVSGVALVGARFGMLVLYNGLRPAICDRAT